MNLERSHRSSNIDLEMTKVRAGREFRYSSSKKDIGRDYNISNNHLKKLSTLIEEMLEDSETKNHEIGQVNPKFHSVEARPMEPKNLVDYLKTLPMKEEEEEVTMHR